MLSYHLKPSSGRGKVAGVSAMLSKVARAAKSRQVRGAEGIAILGKWGQVVDLKTPGLAAVGTPPTVAREDLETDTAPTPPARWLLVPTRQRPGISNGAGPWPLRAGTLRPLRE